MPVVACLDQKKLSCQIFETGHNLFKFLKPTQICKDCANYLHSSVTCRLLNECFTGLVILFVRKLQIHRQIMKYYE